MSYCRFQNTRLDLQDCVDTLETMLEDEENPKRALSKDEYRAMREMIEQCELFVSLAEDLRDLELNELDENSE